MGFSFKPPVGGHLLLQPQDLPQTPQAALQVGVSVSRPVTSGPCPLVSALGLDVPVRSGPPSAPVLCESASLDLAGALDSGSFITLSFSFLYFEGF